MDGICNWENFRVYDFPPPTMKQACETVPRPSRSTNPMHALAGCAGRWGEQAAAGKGFGMGC